MRTCIIGDIHGCADALRAILARLAPGPDDALVLLGDLFDRGPDSWGVFRDARKLADELGDRFILLRGNHEDYLLQEHLTLTQRMVWERVGRGATVKSFRANGARMEDAVPWLREHCRMYWKGGDIQCVHAGLLIDPPEANDANTLLHDHTVVFRNRYAGPLTVVGHIGIADPTYFAGDGRTTEKLPYATWLPLPKTGIICVDTGCGKGGRLTAMTVENGRCRLDWTNERGGV